MCYYHGNSKSSIFGESSRATAMAQRQSSRRAKSHWTQLNMDRCVDLEDRGLMTGAGRNALEAASNQRD